MTNLAKFSVKTAEHEYELSLGWDDGALMEGNVKFDLIALQINIETQEETDAFSATVALIPNPENDEDPIPHLQIVIKHEGSGEEFTKSLPLTEIFEEAQIIDLIPAHIFALGDPITGCLIRSGLSTTVAQTISCKNETAGVEPLFWLRMHQFGKCLLVSIPDMSSKMAKRSFRCIWRFGF